MNKINGWKHARVPELQYQTSFETVDGLKSVFFPALKNKLCLQNVTLGDFALSSVKQPRFSENQVHSSSLKSKPSEL